MRAHSPSGGSQSLNEYVPLNCDRHRSFSFPSMSNSIRWDRMARGGWSWVFPFPHVDSYHQLTLGIFLSSGHLGSHKTPAHKVSPEVKPGSFSSPPARSMRGLLSDTHHEDLTEFLEIKLRKAGCPHPWNFYLSEVSGPPWASIDPSSRC